MPNILFIEPTTELEAVNAILGSVGESPVNALDGDFVDAELAKSLLDAEGRAAQTEGWTFNTELEYPLTPDAEGRIFVPRNTLSFIGETAEVVQRGFQLYDRTNRTYVFTGTVTATKLIVGLHFDLLPEALRRFVMLRAGRRFQDRLQSDQLLHQIQANDEMAAWAAFLNYEASQAQFNVLTSSPLAQRLKTYR
jgi:hypothetical protein